MRELILDERGTWPLIWCLLLLALLNTSWVSTNTNIQTTIVSDINLQESLEIAAKAAANQVNPQSEASGDPRIDPDKAHNTFKKFLARNLGLNENTLEPLPGSSVKRPDYTLAVYNIDNTYSSTGAVAGKLYKFQNGSLTTLQYTPSGNPYMFGINDAEVTPGVAGVFNCTMDRPAVIASLSTELNRMMGTGQIVINRWVPAKIEKIN